MEWLTQYWPYLIAAGLLAVLVVRVVVVLLPKYRQPVRHSGERTIRVIGVGGAGGNAVDHMIRAKQRGVDYIAVNTDAQVLDDSLAPRRVQIGEQLTQGLGAGGDAAIGRQAAEEDAEEINRMVAGSDLVFIAAGLGGGTGSGAAPVIAAQAQKVGALMVGVVTRPFEFEGSGRRKIADAAEAELKANVDTLLLIENERVLSVVGEDTSMLDAFTFVNEVLAGTVRAVVDIMTVPGLINLDFADVRAIMQDGGMATAGIGAAVGPERAVAAAHAAVANPLLNHDLAGAGAILLNVAGASGMTMREVTRAAEVIRSAADPEAMIIFGTIFDDHLDDELRVTVIATRLRDEFAYVSRVASDARSIAETEEPAPAAAARCRGGRGHRCGGRGRSARSRSAEEEDEEEAPRWAAIPIVTSEDEPVAVVASGATAAADLEYAPEPFAPWAASQAYTTYVEPAPAEESAPAEQSGSLQPRSRSGESAAVETAAPAEQSSAEPAEEPEGSRREPWAAAVLSTIRAGRSCSGRTCGAVLVRPRRRGRSPGVRGDRGGVLVRPRRRSRRRRVGGRTQSWSAPADEAQSGSPGLGRPPLRSPRQHSRSPNRTRPSRSSSRLKSRRPASLPYPPSPTRPSAQGVGRPPLRSPPRLSPSPSRTRRFLSSSRLSSPSPQPPGRRGSTRPMNHRSPQPPGRRGSPRPTKHRAPAPAEQAGSPMATGAGTLHLPVRRGRGGPSRSPRLPRQSLSRGRRALAADAPEPRPPNRPGLRRQTSSRARGSRTGLGCADRRDPRARSRRQA